jgi:hypothetical protein
MSLKQSIEQLGVEILANGDEQRVMLRCSDRRVLSLALAMIAGQLSIAAPEIRVCTIDHRYRAATYPREHYEALLDHLWEGEYPASISVLLQGIRR